MEITSPILLPCGKYSASQLEGVLPGWGLGFSVDRYRCDLKRWLIGYLVPVPTWYSRVPFARPDEGTLAWVLISGMPRASLYFRFLGYRVQAWMKPLASMGQGRTHGAMSSEKVSPNIFVTSSTLLGIEWHLIMPETPRPKDTVVAQAKS